MRIDFDQIDQKLKYKVMTASVIPRPPALVTTVDSHGEPNAAPFSFFNCFSDEPPIVALGIGRRASGPKKDTGRNIEETGEFVAHIVDESMFEGMLKTASALPQGINELPLAGFETIESDHVVPPRIPQAPIAFECRRYVTVQCGMARDIVLGEVLAAHIRDDLWDGGREYINWGGKFPIARLYGTLYASLGEVYSGQAPDPDELLK
ncbi:flavin reductase family protein [Oceanibium sediminis]|uniref:flavin reductase family protein n=1 Tax=Oceanibium sediminis TaxID=2026339 RepID=UPI00130058C9|nr:flavin reductase family protein [Oceanibium sediminis]